MCWGSPALVPCRAAETYLARAVTPEQRLGQLALCSVLGSLSTPSAASPSKGSSLSAVLPANSPACPLTRTSIHSFSLGIPALWHISVWSQGAPCPSMAPALPSAPLSLCPALFQPTLCFFPQTMLTAISMSAIATNGVVPGRAKPVSVRVPRVWAAGHCRVGCLQGLFPESIPRGRQPLPSLLPPARAGSPRPGGARSWSRHPSPKPRGADGSESRQPRLLPPPDWRGRGEPGDTRQEDGSRACWVPRAG